MSKRILKIYFLQCNPKTQFTCWSGQCISIEHRCDQEFHCEDKTDEHNCSLVIFDKINYKTEFAPVGSSSNETLKVEVKISQVNIEDIDQEKVSS